MKLGGELGGASVKRKYFSKTIRFRTLVYSYMPKNRLLNEAAIGVIVCFCVNSTVDTFVCACVCVCVCVCAYVFVCVHIFFHREDFFRLQDFCEIPEGTDKRSCVGNILLGVFTKFLHLLI